jgi:NAD(P)-dependent dehydrogenase (short-subunit alcohol dehydrogenase family)
VRAAYDHAEAAFGTVDTVIANAGVSAPGRSTEITAEAMRAVLDTNVLGVLLTAREGARRMIEAGSRDTGRGRVLLIGSLAAEETGLGETIYCASKAAVAHLGRNLAKEWVRLGVNVNVIQPGYIETEMAGGWFDTPAGKMQIAGFNRRRLQPIQSLDFPVLYFCSDASLHTTGATLTVDDAQGL